MVKAKCATRTAVIAPASADQCGFTRKPAIKVNKTMIGRAAIRAEIHQCPKGSYTWVQVGRFIQHLKIEVANENRRANYKPCSPVMTSAIYLVACQDFPIHTPARKTRRPPIITCTVAESHGDSI